MAFLSDTITRDHGIVLRWFPVTESSRIVVWFSENHGRIATLIRGSQRSKSWMLGQYDLFYTCEVLFYTRAREDLYILRECSPLSFRTAFRTHYRACSAASFVADVLYRISPPRAAAPEIYHLATHTLDTLVLTPSPSPLLLFWFELQVYQHLGIAPNLDPHSSPSLSFDYRQGNITPHPTDASARPITDGTLALLRNLLRSESPERLSRIRPLPGQVNEIAGHLERFAHWHLDLALDSRARALEWLSP
jgi:DNA repair protein RecO